MREEGSTTTTTTITATGGVSVAAAFTGCRPSNTQKGEQDFHFSLVPRGSWSVAVIVERLLRENLSVLCVVLESWPGAALVLFLSQSL